MCSRQGTLLKALILFTTVELEEDILGEDEGEENVAIDFEEGDGEEDDEEETLGSILEDD